jgi:hypothetical protein
MYLGKTVKYYENAFVCLVECSKKLQFDRKSSEFGCVASHFVAGINKLGVTLNDTMNIEHH